MSAASFLLRALLLAATGAAVLRGPVRREYRKQGRLPPPAAALQTAVMFSFGFFIWFDIRNGLPPPHLGPAVRRAGLILLVTGLGGLLALMAQLGVRQSTGEQVVGLKRSGPYRRSRNPQIVATSLVVIAFGLIWPSWHALVWYAIWGTLAHLMVLTEEEHLSRTFGDEYRQYCEQVPRYLRLPR